MPTSRWIYGFQQTGSRELTEVEVDQARKLAGRYSRLRYIRGSLAVSLGTGVIVGIMILTDGGWLGWVVIIASVAGFGVSMSWANAAERLSLLFRRTSRVGEVDTFTRVGSNDRVRSFYRAPYFEDEEEFVASKPYWEVEERFEEAIRKEAGREPDTIETPKGDDAIVTVNGRWVTLVHEIGVFDLEKKG